MGVPFERALQKTTSFSTKPLSVVDSTEAWHARGSEIEPGHTQLLPEHEKKVSKAKICPSVLQHFRILCFCKITPIFLKNSVLIVLKDGKK